MLAKQRHQIHALTLESPALDLVATTHIRPRKLPAFDLIGLKDDEHGRIELVFEPTADVDPLPKNDRLGLQKLGPVIRRAGDLLNRLLLLRQLLHPSRVLFPNPSSLLGAAGVPDRFRQLLSHVLDLLLHDLLAMLNSSQCPTGNRAGLLKSDANRLRLLRETR